MNKLGPFLQFLLAVIGLLLAMIAVRFPFPGNLISLLLITAMVVAFYYRNVIAEKRKQKEYEKSFLGQMDIKRQDCLSKITILKKELQHIDGNIREIQLKLEANPQANSMATSESQKLIDGFNEEKKLRQSKIDFYELAQTKLNQIIKNHQLTEDLKMKREKLEALRETNIDEVADMEGMKSFIDYERTYIETIDELSLKMLDSRTPENAEVLKLELVEMTKELREL